jgi:hypothetical protein
VELPQRKNCHAKTYVFPSLSLGRSRPPRVPLLFTAEAVTVLGGADLDKYCHSIGGEKVSLKGANGYSWHCTKANGQELPLSVLQACKVTYNDNDAVDLLENYFNPYS